MSEQEQVKGDWYNYQTQKHEFIATPTDLAPYIPQDPAAQGLFECYVGLGDSPLIAAVKVLKASLGLEPKV